MSISDMTKGKTLDPEYLKLISEAFYSSPAVPAIDLHANLPFTRIPLKGFSPIMMVPCAPPAPVHLMPEVVKPKAEDPPPAYYGHSSITAEQRRESRLAMAKKLMK